MNDHGSVSGAAAADRPSDIPPRGWKEILVATWKQAGEDNVSLLAAGMAFYIFLAFVPLLTAFVLSYGLVAEPASVVEHMRTLTRMMPQNAAELIGEQLIGMTSTENSETGFALVLALAVALYGASKGAVAVITALNVAFEVEERRGFVKRTAMALAMTAGAVLVLFLAIVAIAAMQLVERLLPDWGGVMHLMIKIGSFALAALAVVLLLAVVYRYGPNRPEAEWKWITPGSALATLVWLGATFGFGVYVSNFGNYNATYGSLGAIIVFLTWLYLSAYIVIMGAELNSELERKVGRDKVADESASGESTPKTRPPANIPPVAARPDPRPSLGQVAWKLGAFAILLRILPRRRAWR